MKHQSRFTRLRRLRMRPGTVLGMIALSVALSGTAYGLAGSNTVFSDDIVNGEVRRGDIRNGAVSTRDIAAGGVQDADLGTLVVREDRNTLNDGASGRAEVDCDAGERLIGGGGRTQQSAPDAIYHGDHPNLNSFGDLDSWEANATNEASSSIANLTSIEVVAYAICLQ